MLGNKKINSLLKLNKRMILYEILIKEVAMIFSRFMVPIKQGKNTTIIMEKIHPHHLNQHYSDNKKLCQVSVS